MVNWYTLLLFPLTLTRPKYVTCPWDIYECDIIRGSKSTCTFGLALLCFWDPGHLEKKSSPERWRHKTQMTASTNCHIYEKCWKWNCLLVDPDKTHFFLLSDNSISIIFDLFLYIYSGKVEWLAWLVNIRKIGHVWLCSRFFFSLKVSLTQEGQTPLCFFRISLYPTWPAFYSHC